MAHPDPAQIRNVAVLGHRGSGKTSLVEAMLFAAGETNRLGSVAEGTTVADFDDDERRRTMSISASLCHLTWNGVKVNLIDTPGEPSFQGEILTALRAVNAALMVLNATSGVEVQTERLWRRAEELGLPRAAVVNMLDRERADFDATMAALKELAPRAVAIQIPMGSEAGFRGVVNLVSMTATTYDAASPTGSTGPIPDDLADTAQAAREALIDVVAENDDALIEKYLEGEEITTEELIGAILAGVKEGRIFPVVCAAGAPAIAVDRALDLVTEALPSPADAAPREAVDIGSGEAVTIALAEDGPGDRVLLQDARRPVQRPHQPAAGGLGHARRTTATRPARGPAARSGSASSSPCRARTTCRCRRSAPATSAPSPSSRTSRPATCSRPGRRWPSPPSTSRRRS